MMQRYREKTKVIEAVQFDPTAETWTEGVNLWAGRVQHSDGTWGWIVTSDGGVYVREGDWIVRGASGALHVCPDKVFSSLYELVEVPLD